MKSIQNIETRQCLVGGGVFRFYPLATTVVTFKSSLENNQTVILAFFTRVNTFCVNMLNTVIKNVRKLEKFDFLYVPDTHRKRVTFMANT